MTIGENESLAGKFVDIGRWNQLGTIGADVAVPTLGGEATLNIPAGTQSHTLFRLRGKGLPHLRGFGRGDELVRVLVHTPKKLSSRQKDLLRDLAEALGEDVDSGRRVWEMDYERTDNAGGASKNREARSTLTTRR